MAPYRLPRPQLARLRARSNHGKSCSRQADASSPHASPFEERYYHLARRQWCRQQAPRVAWSLDRDGAVFVLAALAIIASLSPHKQAAQEHGGKSTCLTASGPDIRTPSLNSGGLARCGQEGHQQASRSRRLATTLSGCIVEPLRWSRLVPNRCTPMTPRSVLAAQNRLSLWRLTPGFGSRCGPIKHSQSISLT